MENSQCCYCLCEIAGHFIRCSECPDFDLCLQCFSLGAEIGPHRKEHGYRIVNDGVVRVFDISNPWSLAEETMLLDAVEQYGFGNWEDVSNHVSSRTPAECQDHYVAFYIQGNIGRAAEKRNFPGTETKSRTCIRDLTLESKKREDEKRNVSAHCQVPLPPVELTAQEQQELGYMPFRDDFEREYDNDAESLVSSLSVNYDDEDIDIAIKISQVDKYRIRLQEREQRKRLAREYGLLTAATSNNNKSKPPPKKKTTKDEREFQEKMRVFAQFHSCEEHEQYFEDLQKEKELKARIKELMRLRKNGLMKMEEIDVFEDEKYKREKRKDNKKKVGSSAQAKRSSMASKKAEEKLDILIDDDDEKGDDDDEDTKEMAALPGYDMLSNGEKKLCNSLRLTPSNYITIKTCIIKDYLQRQQGLPVKIRYPSGLDKTHRRKIISFLTDNGWIGVT